MLLVVIGAIVFAFINGQKERASEAERERPVKAASRVSVQDNEPVISIDAATQLKSGIAAAPLQSTTHQAEQPAYAQVLEMHDWGDARSAYLTAKGENIKAVNAATESRMDFERAKLLQKGSGVSTESVQDAEVKARAADAAAQRRSLPKHRCRFSKARCENVGEIRLRAGSRTAHRSFNSFSITGRF